MNSILEECANDIEYNGLKKNKVAHRVLIADDAMFIRRSISKILTSVGYEIVGEAENGQDAVDKYFELTPGITTMDITMPVMEGIEAVEKIIARDNTAKIVMVSAMGYQGMVKDAILKGAKNFVVKPIKPDNVKKFLKIIKTVVGDS
ncbi:MAG: two-component system response regulator [Candidatus Cloacimonadota bacterium]|nr:MAG: two-component system response regulator [Candidatus Cloacimonadota bacterium]